MSLKSRIKNPIPLAVVVTALILLALLSENLLGGLRGQPDVPGIDVKAVIRKIEEAELTPREALYYEVIHGDVNGSGEVH